MEPTPTPAPAATASTVSPRIQRLAAIGAMAIAFAHNLSYSWLKWGNPLIDCGREIDCARQLAEGKSLYADVRYLFGPLAPKINEWLFRIFGVHLNTLLAAGAISAALMCWVMYRLARRFTTRAPATLIVIGFLYICAFAHTLPIGIFNYVLPYAYAATYGSVAALASLLFLVRHAQKQRPLDFLLSAACLALVALTKVEILFGIVILHVAFVAAMLSMRRIQLRTHVLGYGAALLAVGAIYGYFIWNAGAAVVYDNIVFQLFSKGTNRLNQSKMGFADVKTSLLGIAYSFAAVAGLLAFCMAAARLPARVAAYGAAAIAAFVLYLYLDADYQFSCLNVLGAGICLYFLITWIRHPERRVELLPHALMWIYGTACLARLGLMVSSAHYGFFLLPGGLIAFGLFWFKYLPAWLGRAGLPNRIFQFAGAGMFAALIWCHYDISRSCYALHTAEIRTARGHLFLLDIPGNLLGSNCASAVRLMSKMPPGSKAIIFPQGEQLTFLSGCDNPIGQFGFTPTEFNETYTDERLLAEMKAASPDLVVLAKVDMREISDAQMGIDYLQKTCQWINESYSPIAFDKDHLMVVFARNGMDLTPLKAQ